MQKSILFHLTGSSDQSLQKPQMELFRDVLGKYNQSSFTENNNFQTSKMPYSEVRIKLRFIVVWERKAG